MPRTKPAVPPIAPQENILRAAADEFAERGFEGARVDEIARRAGVNKAMLYYHVGDKAALYEKVLVDAVSTAASRVQAGIADQDTPEGKLLAVARAFEGVAREKPHMPRIMLRELATGGRDLPRPVLQVLAGILSTEQTLLASGHRQKRLRAANALSVHIMLVGGIMLHMAAGGVKRRMDEIPSYELPEPPDHPAEAVAGLLLNGLINRPGGSKARNPARPRKTSSKEGKQ